VRICVIRQLEIIGEAARSIPQEFKISHPEVPWTQIGRMWNVLIPIYFGVDQDIIRELVEQDLHVLNSSVDALLASQEGTSNT
jgi:uncharacterized protein with HEPN domain